MIALEMYRASFPELSYGYGSAVAVMLFVLVIPFMLLNVRRIARRGDL